MSRKDKQVKSVPGSTVYNGNGYKQIDSSSSFYSLNGYPVKPMKPQVKHVVNAQQEVHIKTSKMADNQNGFQPGFQNGYQPGYRVKSVPYPPVDFNSNRLQKTGNHYVSLPSRQQIIRVTSNTKRNDVILATKPLTLSETSNSNTTKQNNDFLHEEQTRTLEKVSEALKEIGDSPPAKDTSSLDAGFESSDSNDVTMDTDETPPSRSSTISDKSVNSKTGIIPKRGKNRNSVSFKLPEGHVDKPYSPMQAKPKIVQQNGMYRDHNPTYVFKEPQPQPMYTAICIKSRDGRSVLHTGDRVIIDSKPRRSGGSFKGSIRKFFSSKYDDSELRVPVEQTGNRHPSLFHTIDSFESMNLGGEQVAPGGITRRSTMRY